jgi:hypothetical protein
MRWFLVCVLTGLIAHAQAAPLVDGAGQDAAPAALGRGVVLGRAEAAFVPASGDLPALAIGGVFDDADLASRSTVEAIFKSGAVIGLPPLSGSRQGALAIRLRSGILVGGGRSGDRAAVPAFEWAALGTTADTNRWHAVDAAGLNDVITLGLSADGAGLLVSGTGDVNHISVEQGADGRVRLQARPLPSLNRMRRRDAGDTAAVQIRGLADGRIVVAGGSVQSNKIALLDASSERSDAVDRYVGTGVLLPWRRYEIYEPTLGRWRNSTPSRGAGGPAAILDDGRVVKLSKGARGGEEMLLEMSSADGASWQSINNTLPANLDLRLHGIAHLSAVDGELFLLAGTLGYGDRALVLHWYDMASKSWDEIWQMRLDSSELRHLGRHIVRVLRNGKTVVVPVRGE